MRGAAFQTAPDALPAFHDGRRHGVLCPLAVTTTKPNAAPRASCAPSYRAVMPCFPYKTSVWAQLAHLSLCYGREKFESKNKTERRRENCHASSTSANDGAPARLPARGPRTVRQGLAVAAPASIATTRRASRAVVLRRCELRRGCRRQQAAQWAPRLLKLAFPGRIFVRKLHCGHVAVAFWRART